MKQVFVRPLLAALVAAGAVSAAQANQVTVEFKTLYDTSTFFNLNDTDTLGYKVAQLELTDLVGGNGVTGKLAFYDTEFAAKAGKSLTVKDLWLAGDDKGTVSGVTGTPVQGSFYKYGFWKQGQEFNYDLSYQAGAFKEGQNSTFTIKGAGVSVDTFLNSKGDDVNGIILEINNVGKPYSGFLGLTANARFIGEVVVLPEPSTYALMGLGLVGVFAASRRRKSA